VVQVVAPQPSAARTAIVTGKPLSFGSVTTILPSATAAMCTPGRAELGRRRPLPGTAPVAASSTGR